MEENLQRRGFDSVQQALYDVLFSGDRDVFVDDVVSDYFDEFSLDIRREIEEWLADIEDLECTDKFFEADRMCILPIYEILKNKFRVLFETFGCLSHSQIKLAFEPAFVDDVHEIIHNFSEDKDENRGILHTYEVLRTQYQNIFEKVLNAVVNDLSIEYQEVEDEVEKLLRGFSSKS